MSNQRLHIILSGPIKLLIEAIIKMVICQISEGRSFHWYLIYQILTNPDIVTDALLFQKNKGLNGGYLDNTKHLLIIFWLSNIKKLNFRLFNTNSKKFTVTVVFCSREKQNGSRKANIILSSISKDKTIPYYFKRFPKTTEGVGRLPKMSNNNKTFTRRNLIISQEHVRITNVLFIYFSRKTLQTLTFISPETAFIQKLANLTANSWATNAKH